ncbi:NADPH oxidoreductase [Frankia sp. AiPs1]|uniref:ferredoxin reductase n=1 Tax=Frankia sp. AiPa1 TaxID=573492 RepID=UPI00202AF3AC|nr:ferredoxin reductase [Frankia sp. AiPa1]MCL9758598.1 ferredoxin reductase [Frankia sp. AiPa1]
MTARAVPLRLLSGAASLLATPLHVDDFVEMVNPLWSGRQTWGRVRAVQAETADAATLTIRPGRGWRGHRAGQYVGIAVPVTGVWRHRVYSVSSAPDRPDGCFQITVQAFAGGQVSPRLVSGASLGTVLRLDPPAGEFTLPEKVPRRILFLTAGSGVTPVMSMLRDLAQRRELPDVVLLHLARTRNDVIFGTELRRLAQRFPGLRLHEFYTRTAVDTEDDRDGPRVSLTDLLAACPDWPERSTWACGPPGLLDKAQDLWREAGVAGHLRVERFRLATNTSRSSSGNGHSEDGRDIGRDGDVGDGASVHFTRSGQRAVADGLTPLLAIGERAGVSMPSGCRLGICRSCVARLGAGRVRDLRTGVEHGVAGDLIQTCVSAAAGDVAIDL